MIVEILGELEDEVALTGALRELRRERPYELIRVVGAHYVMLFERVQHVLLFGEEDSDMHIVLRPFQNVYLGNPVMQFCQALGVRVVYDTRPYVVTTQEDDAIVTQVWEHLRDSAQSRPVVAIDPWSAYPQYRLPSEWWRSLTGRLMAEGYFVVEVGMSDRPDLTKEWRSGMVDGARPLVGMFSPPELMRFLSRCDCLVSHWNGSVPLAAMLGKPVILLVPSYPPPSAFTWPTVHVLANLQEDCVGCSTVRGWSLLAGWEKAPECRQPAGKRCLDAITVADVLNHVSCLLR